MATLDDLVNAIAAQTEAINALADSNMALVAALIDTAGDEDVPATDLDGQPCR